jgi:hypothetical protein
MLALGDLGHLWVMLPTGMHEDWGCPTPNPQQMEQRSEFYQVRGRRIEMNRRRQLALHQRRLPESGRPGGAPSGRLARHEVRRCGSVSAYCLARARICGQASRPESAASTPLARRLGASGGTDFGGVSSTVRRADRLDHPVDLGVCGNSQSPMISRTGPGAACLLLVRRQGSQPNAGCCLIIVSARSTWPLCKGGEWSRIGKILIGGYDLPKSPSQAPRVADFRALDQPDMVARMLYR